MGYCQQHGWYEDSTSTEAGCPVSVHHYPPESAPRVTFSQHDEQRCDLCRALNEAKAQHYKMLPGPTITVRP